MAGWEVNSPLVGTTAVDGGNTTWTVTGVSGTSFQLKGPGGEVMSYTSTDGTLDGLASKDLLGDVSSAGGGSGSSTSELDSSDFASVTGLPEWASNWTQGQVSGNANDAFAAYQQSVQDLANAPANTELNRTASNQAFTRTLQSETDKAAREGARSLASRGASSSSVGADYMADLTASTMSNVLAQQTNNQGAATSNYQNLTDQAEANTGLANMIGEYVGASKESYDPDYGDLSLAEPENVFSLSGNDGTGTVGTDGSLDPNATYGNSHIDPGTYQVSWDPPAEFGDPDPVTGLYSFNGQTFGFDETTGKLTSYSAAGSDAEELNVDDLAATSGLPEAMNTTVEAIMNTYGTPAVTGAVNATNALNAGGDFTNQQANTLNTQYMDLANPASALLGAAAGQVTGNLAPATVYQNAIASELAKAGAQASAGTELWRTTQQNQNLSDRVNANDALTAMLGNYLGMTNYSYNPNYWSTLGLSAT